jgi:hypothetical protein
MQHKRQRLVFPREVLLVEIERHCEGEGCGARARVGLTKEEARLYDGFECERCERWNADGLAERDIPEWWEELTVTGLGTLRGRRPEGEAAPEADGAGGVVARLSGAWQSELARGGGGGAGANSGDRGRPRGDERAAALEEGAGGGDWPV